MKTRISLLFMFTLAILVSNGQEMFDAEEYKFKMMIPEGFEFETYEKDGFGVMEGREEESNTSLLAYAYIGEASKDEIYSFGVEETGIPEDNWESVDEGANENGFEWWEVYQATYNKRVLYAVLGKNAYNEIYYLFFVLAPEKSFEMYEDDYNEWIESCKGVK